MHMTATTSKEAPTRTINVRLPLAVFQQLDLLARATDCTKSLVALESLCNYLETQSSQVKEIEEAIADADRGDFATDAQVNAVLSKYGA